jgi:hypothetical protein
MGIAWTEALCVNCEGFVLFRSKIPPAYQIYYGFPWTLVSRKVTCWFWIAEWLYSFPPWEKTFSCLLNYSLLCHDSRLWRPFSSNSPHHNWFFHDIKLWFSIQTGVTVYFGDTGFESCRPDWGLLKFIAVCYAVYRIHIMKFWMTDELERIRKQAVMI